MPAWVVTNTVMFIAFEGLDGSGKSTLIQSLATWLKGRGHDLIVTREPGGTPLAEEIRQLLLRVGSEVPAPRTELLLYEAARAQHVAQVIAPALQAGKWVLCDRFIASTVAFQCFARKLPRQEVDWLNHFAIESSVPDLTILLDLPVTESLSRTNHRNQKSGLGNDRFEREKCEFHEAVRQGYLTQAREEPAKWLVVDANESREMILKNVQAALEAKLCDS